MQCKVTIFNPISGLKDPPLMTAFKKHSDLLNSYAFYLKEFYTRISQGHTSHHWAHLPQCEFIQLAMTTCTTGQQPQPGGPEEMARLAQLGQIETIMRHKEQVDLVDLFLPPSISPPPSSPTISHQLSSQALEPSLEVLTLPPLKRRVFLIEGAPGAGKSTLVLHVCHEWAQYAYWLQKFDIVVLAYLRDQAIQNASTLADILPADTLHFSQLHIHVNDVATQITNSGGVRVLFIFDGWDEFPSTLQSKSLVSTIIQEPHKLNLQQSTVIITSRPVASKNLLHITDQRVKVLGFNRQQIHEYIEKALDGNNTNIQKLVQHLEEHPVIEGHCYIPLHAAILVHIFLTMKRVLPTNLHELFRDLVLCCIVREVKTHTPVKIVADVSSLDDLPDDLKSQLSALCVLAYERLMHKEVLEDFQGFTLPTNPPSLGLLQAVQGLTLSASKSVSFNFLHLSIQELLAAYHISQMDPSKQVEMVKEMLGSYHFHAVLYYYSGFTRLHNPEIQQFISSYGQQQTHFDDILPLLLCFFEAQQPSLCQIVDQRFRRRAKLGSTSLNPLDYLAVGYFITSLLSTSTADQPDVHLQVSHIDEHCLKLLLSELSKYPFRGADIKHRLVLDMVGPSITRAITEILAEYLKQSHIISELSIVKGDFQDELIYLKQSHIIGELSIVKGELSIVKSDFQDGLIYLAEALQTNSHLTKLQLQYMNLQYTPKNLLVINKMLEVNKTLTHLDLSMNRTFLKSGADSIFFQGLQSNTALVHLNLSNMGITASGQIPRVLGKMLQENKTLAHLDLSMNCGLLMSGADSIFQGLQDNTALVYLNLSNTGITASWHIPPVLGKMLRVNKTLTHLDLSMNCIFIKSGADSFFISLLYNAALVHLNLSNTGILASESIPPVLGKMLQINKTLTHLDLSVNDMFKNETFCIFEGLQHNSTLLHLNLSCTRITVSKKSSQALSKALRTNKTLKHLNLSGNVAFSNIGACCVFRSLRHNTTLVHLDLRNTGITAKKDTVLVFTQLLDVNKALQYVDISQNELSKDVQTSPSNVIIIL